MIPLLLSLVVQAQAQTVPVIMPAPPALAAKSYILVDFDSNVPIVEKLADERIEPASLTKIMAAYIIFDELRKGTLSLEDLVTVSAKAWRTGGSKTFIEVGKQVRVEDLLRGMIVQSGNDATIALAEHIAGTEEVFAAMMNQQAKNLGMLNSHFTNSTGLPDRELFTTARDLAILARAMIQRFPEYYRWYAEKEFTFNNITQRNRNLLLWRDETVDGMKTGHTESAGYCLVASAKREGMRLVSVILGAKSENGRAQETQSLLNFGFRFYETHKLYSANEALSTARIWKGAVEQLPIGLQETLFVTIPRGQYPNLNASVQLLPTITAPASMGQEMGTVQISLDGKLVAERPLIALQDVEEGGFISRLVDEVMLMIKQ